MNCPNLKYITPIICLLSTGVFAQHAKTKPVTDLDYREYGGNKAGNRYTPLTQINKTNVKDLQVNWTYDTGDNTGGRGNDWQYQPIVVKGVMYVVTPRAKLVALDAATGKQIWIFDPAVTGKRPGGPVRCVTYWENGDDKRVIYNYGYVILEVNATTGEQIKTFGDDGLVDIHIGLKDNEVWGADPQKWGMRNTSPGAVYKDVYIVGSSMSEGQDAPPGYIQAFNVVTGKLLWVFHTIPLPGEYGYATWGKDSYKKLGAANDWTGLVIDDKRGIAYVSTGSSSVDFYGGIRPGMDLFANCIIALDAKTGKRLWHFQTIHHDMWDRDLPCPGNLITITRNGKRVDAIAQPTKDGLLFVLDRVTGKPLFPVKETKVPTTPALPGEHPWPTQPIPTLPKPFAMQELTEKTITDRTPEAHAYVLERYNNSLHGSKYMPPSEKGTLYFGFGGGAEWGGTAVDPKGIIYINANNMLWWQKMTDVAKRDAMASVTPGSALFNATCASCHGSNGGGANGGDGAQPYPVLTNVGDRLNRDQISSLLETGRGRMPSFQNVPKADRDQIVDFLLHTEKNVPAARNNAGKQRQTTPWSTPYQNNGTQQFRDNEGYPAMKAPWGTLNAINLNTGAYLWTVPFGEYPDLIAKGLPPTGTENHGGAVVTGGGLLFIAATYDENLRAFDTKTGKVIWKYKLPAGGFATPISYMVNGKQYVTIVCGGTRYNLKPGGTMLTFALPNK
ncbi:PQQ-binding-like beta-propeller repeat protein [Mucilaginibacter sp.]|uniref:outer membrane protein assembly factor BamB family protein n=1 Tax=Mucilaginibacter sp. TaxID=1882438 RepID=UPI00262DC0F3|nr:PQQ-binding-like beta-propeller repeat protein [Mucilaginibacter sp.]MDB5031855.1 quinoprotein glucose dehydrogenase [Mucilaginibacter sp.]